MVALVIGGCVLSAWAMLVIVGSERKRRLDKLHWDMLRATAPSEKPDIPFATDPDPPPPPAA